MPILPSGHRQHDEQSGDLVHVLALRDLRADLEQQSSPGHAFERPMDARLMAGARGSDGRHENRDRRANAELLDRVEGHIEEIRHNLIVEIKKLTKLHEQVDEVRLAMRELKSRSK